MKDDNDARDRGAREATWFAAAFSLGAHACLGVLAAWLLSRSLQTTPASLDETYPQPADDAPLIVELPQSIGELAATPAEVPTPPVPAVEAHAGGAAVARIDERIAGRGGDDTSPDRARSLAPRAEEQTLTSAITDDLERDQENRLRSGVARRTSVDRRIAIQPMEMTFVASGHGFRFERHPIAMRDSAMGVQQMHPATTLGGVAGDVAPPDGDGERSLSRAAATTPGDAHAVPTEGAHYGVAVGSVQLIGAPIGKARPHVDKGRQPAVAADGRGVPSDSMDSDQAVADALRSIVSSSTAGGSKVGDGRGGSGGGGATTGSGGASGDGSASEALADGDGALDGPRDRRTVGWFLAMTRSLGALVDKTFPREVELDLRSGTVIVDLTVSRAGDVVAVVVVRPSGYAEFDQNVVERLRAARGLPPIPSVLAIAPQTLRVPITGGWHLH